MRKLQGILSEIHVYVDSHLGSHCILEHQNQITSLIWGGGWCTSCIYLAGLQFALQFEFNIILKIIILNWFVLFMQVTGSVLRTSLDTQICRNVYMYMSVLCNVCWPGSLHTRNKPLKYYCFEFTSPNCIEYTQ